MEKQGTMEMDRDYAAAYFGDEESLKNMVSLKLLNAKEASRKKLTPMR
jgi:hypothetical protein